MDFIILSLAVWRISNLLVDESGPYDILSKFRYAIGIDYTDRGERFTTNEFAELFDCVFCLSVWVGLFVSLCYFSLPTYTIYVCYPFALSAVACGISKWTQ